MTAVVVNHNGLRHLRRCIAALRASSHPIERCIVVDSGSTDSSVTWLRENHPGVQVLALRENAGPAHARNVGLDQARTALVLMLDCDAALRPETLGLLISGLRTCGPAAVACPRVCLAGSPEVIQHGAGRCHFLGLGALEDMWTGPGAARGASDRGDYTAFGSTALLIDKSLLPPGLRFDPGFWFFCEDTDFSLRVAAAGLKIMHVPQAVVLHGNERLAAEAAGSHRYPAERMVYHSRNRRLVILRNFDARTILLTLPLQLLFECLTLVLAVRERLLGAYFEGALSFARALPAALKARRAILRLKRLPDRRLLTGEPLPIRPCVLRAAGARTVASGFDALCRSWWGGVRKVL